MSQLCLCLTSSTIEGALAQLQRYETSVDMAELRVDLLNPQERASAGRIACESSVPLILTIRLPVDGGRWGDSGETETERQALFLNLLESSSWSWIDLESEYTCPEIVTAARNAGTRIIRSIHDFDGQLAVKPVSELAALLRSLSGDSVIPKLAVICNSSRDLLTLARLAIATEDIDEKIILGMGEYGAPTRILAQKMGSAWTYTSSVGGPDDPPVAAPGQFDPVTLQDLYRFKSIGPDTPLYAVTGNPLAHSRSPEIHNRWLRELGQAGTYLPIRSDDAAAMLETCDIWGIRGLSVTVPHKETALGLCDYSGVLARNIGAANTLLRAGDGWRARNTDAGGFMAPLPAALGLKGTEELKGMRALIIGAGGAARAVFFALLDAGVDIVLLNRTADKARKLAGNHSVQWGSLEENSRSLIEVGIDFVIQTSSAGMHPLDNVDPLPWWNFEGCRLAYDIVYEPEETVFLRRAREAGVTTMNGSKMLTNQARIQFEMFTGQSAPAK